MLEDQKEVLATAPAADAGQKENEAVLVLQGLFMPQQLQQDLDRMAKEDLATVHEMWYDEPQKVPDYIGYLNVKHKKQKVYMADHLSRLDSIKTIVRESPLEVGGFIADLGADFNAYLHDKWK